MQRVIAHYLSRDMAVLGIIEAVLSFAAIYAVIAVGGSLAAARFRLFARAGPDRDWPPC